MWWGRNCALGRPRARGNGGPAPSVGVQEPGASVCNWHGALVRGPSAGQVLGRGGTVQTRPAGSKRGSRSFPQPQCGARELTGQGRGQARPGAKGLSQGSCSPGGGWSSWLSSYTGHQQGSCFWAWDSGPANPHPLRCPHPRPPLEAQLPHLLCRRQKAGSGRRGWGQDTEARAAQSSRGCGPSSGLNARRWLSWGVGR